MEISKGLREAAFAAGCFWGVEARFMEVNGVVETEVGYMGGTTEGPTYKDVCSGRTGHAETVHLIYDPLKVSYQQLLEEFWSMHNPTTPNRQGVDVGSQYRSVIFYYDQEQRELAERSRDALDASKRYKKEVVTEIVPAPVFWRAEEYHQRYFEKKGGGTCHL